MANREQNKKHKNRLLIVYVAVSVVALIGGILPFALPRQDTIAATGNVTFVDQEGGFYALIGDNGSRYDPTNLNNAYFQNGLRVKFEGTIRSDLVSTHQWGPLIQITKIEKLP